jgi:hypothetical protein
MKEGGEEIKQHRGPDQRDLNTKRSLRLPRAS